MLWLLSAVSSLLLLGTGAHGAPMLDARTVSKRDLLEAYDYVVVGAGTAGTVIANRLSEDSDVSVLVIEAGGLDGGENFVHIPRNVGGAMGTKYDWRFSTVAQTSINNRRINIPAGKVVGGGTVLNGMCFDLGAKHDYESWEELGNKGWGWDELFPYFRKVETFTPPSANLAKLYNISWDMSAHGTSGPIYASYPNWLQPTIPYFHRALGSLGIPLEKESSGGRALNAMWAPNSLHPTNMSRSYARPGYFDPALKRANFHVLYNSQVVKLIGSGSPVKITGVQYQVSRNDPITTINVNKEVIVSGGAVNSPKLLQLSGIGSADLLKKYNIAVLVDLPGVGTNYQDHPFSNLMAQTSWTPPLDPSLPTGNAEQLYLQNRTGPWTNAGPVGFGFIPLPKVVDATTLQQRIRNITGQSPSAYLRPGTHQTVVNGFAKQKEILAKYFNSDDMAVTEFIGGGGSMSVSPQHQLSRGYLEIASADPFQDPIIDPRYGSNPIDLDFFMDAARFARKVWNTPIMQEMKPRESSPGAMITSDDQLRAWARSSASTMFHSCCTNPMQPRDLGGVVDTNAIVYGTSNLRISDASIMPLIPATHIQKSIYGSAEKIADMIKAARAG